MEEPTESKRERNRLDWSVGAEALLQVSHAHSQVQTVLCKMMLSAKKPCFDQIQKQIMHSVAQIAKNIMFLLCILQGS